MRHLTSFEAHSVSGGELYTSHQLAYVTTLLIAGVIETSVKNAISNMTFTQEDSYVAPYVQPVLKAGSTLAGYIFTNKFLSN